MQPPPCHIAFLPPELLTRIFEIAHTDTCVVDYGGKNGVTIPSTVSKVCKIWRLIALEHSFWWTNIYISPPWKLDAIYAYLKRSKQLPLNLHISIHLDLYEVINPTSGRKIQSLDHYEALIALISPHFPRVRAFHLDGIFSHNNDLPFHFVGPMSGIQMPHLEEFTFDGRISHSSRLIKRFSFLSSLTAPNLRLLRLGGFAANCVCPPLSTITSLHLSAVRDKGYYINFESFGKLIEACTSMTILSLYDDVLDIVFGLPVTYKVLSLEQLNILGNVQHVSELLVSLDAPNLRELTIAPVIGGDLFQLFEHTANSEPHFPALKSLTLAPAQPQAWEPFTGASGCFPNIERLILPNVYHVQFFDAFVDAENIPRPLFPDLIEIAITDVEPQFLTTLYIVDKARRETHNFGLKTIYADSKSIKLFSSEMDRWKDVKLVEDNKWERERMKAMYHDNKSMFVGIPR